MTNVHVDELLRAYTLTVLYLSCSGGGGGLNSFAGMLHKVAISMGAKPQLRFKETNVQVECFGQSFKNLAQCVRLREKRKHLNEPASVTRASIGSQALFPASRWRQAWPRPWVHRRPRRIKSCSKMNFTVSGPYTPCLLPICFSHTHTRSQIIRPASLTARQLFLHNGIFHLTTSQDGLPPPPPQVENWYQGRTPM